MRTKKTGRLADRASDGEQESDGGSEENSQLPVDSSSDDEDLPASALGGAGRPALGGVSGTQGGAMAHMPPLVPHGHLNTAVPGGVAAVSGQPQNHLSQPHPVSTAAPNASARASGAVAAGADTLRPKAPSQRAAAASEDPTARRLRAQIRAVWLLQRDLPVPGALLAETKGATARPPSITPSADQAPIRAWSTYDNLVSTLCRAQSAADRAACNSPQPPPSIGEGFVRVAGGAQQARAGLVEHLARMRATRLREQMQRRQAFLLHTVTTNMPSLVADRLDLERKQLEMYEMQLEVRRALLASHVDHGVLPPHDLPLLKTSETRLDRTVVQEESQAEWEERMRQAEVQSKVNRRKAFLQDMRKTQESFKREHDSIRRCRAQICRDVKAWHRNAEKSKEKERMERLQALKSNDFDKYREYVKEAKNERMMELIAKTDNYLSSLAAKMSRASKELGSSDAKTTESLLELDHKILPIDDAAADAEKLPTEVDGEKSPAKLDRLGNGEQDTTEKDEDAQKPQSVDDIFDAVKNQAIAMKQPKIMGDGDTGMSKEEGKPPLLLKPYQLQGLQWMATLYNNNLSGILADEMGLGKTIQVIALLTYLVETKGDHGPFMVIAPLSTITNWALEFQRWAPSLNVVVYKGSAQVRKDLFKTRMQKTSFNVLIIQYEMVMSAPDLRMLKTIKWTYMVVDEGHRLKNKDSKLFVVLTKEYSTHRKLILTGTPLQNNIGELWNLLNFLLPTVFDTDADFKTWFSKPFSDGADDDEEADASQEEQMVLINRLHQVLRPFMLRRVKTDKDLELSMPENREVVIKCALSALQKIQYRQLSYATLRTRDEKGNLKTTSYNNTIMRLRQVCNHPYMLDDPNKDAKWNLGPELRVRACGKLDVLDRILPKLKAAGHRVLIYSQMVTLLEILAEYIEERGFNYFKLIGATSHEIRSEMIEAFNKPDSDIFLFILSTRAGGQGVNLQTADTVIIFDSDWNPMMDEQAKARINRIGQTRQTLVIRLMTPGTVEEKMLSRANARLRMGDLVIEAGAFKVGASSKDAQSLLREKLDQDGILADIAQIDNDVASEDEINELIMRREEELVMWQEMDAKLREERATNGLDKMPRLMQEEEVPEELLGERISTGDRVVLLDDRLATVGKKVSPKGHEWQVEVDDTKEKLTVHTTELMLAPMLETEETYEAARLGRRKQTNRSHGVSHGGLTDAEFTRCLESGIDIDTYIKDKRDRAERAQGASSKKRRRSSTRGGDRQDEDDESDGDEAYGSRNKRRR